MRSGNFQLEVFTPEKADVYLAANGDDSIWPLVKRLDEACIRVIGDVADLDPDDDRLQRILRGCSGLAVILPCTTEPRVLREVGIGTELGIPIAIFREQDDWGETASRLDCFVADVLRDKDRMRPYAFFIGRLERDFTQAREAIRAAVASEAGIPCLWSDDGRHRMEIESVRERTRLLIQHATFVIADLTLGRENPERENPSRAHEIGMAIAYGKKLMLCSQEPRRYPYFSIGDMQMSFWSTEAELESQVREWVRFNRGSLAQSVFNGRLRQAYPDYSPKVENVSFRFDPRLRFVGPKTPRFSHPRGPMIALGFAAVAVLVALLTIVASR